jgi:AcrR family transcriptional regulator
MSKSATVADARSEILNSAISVFARKGYAGTGVQEILDPINLSKPTLYYYFESKAGLFKAILDHAYDESYRLIKEAVLAGDSCEDKLVRVANALFEFTTQNQDLTRLVFGTVFAASEENPPHCINASKRRRIFELLLGILKNAQQTDEIDKAYDPNDLAHAFFGTVSHRTRSYLLLQTGELDEEVARRIVALFLNGARKGRK